jgi:hypothetical protein
MLIQIVVNFKLGALELMKFVDHKDFLRTMDALMKSGYRWRVHSIIPQELHFSVVMVCWLLLIYLTNLGGFLQSFVNGM